MPPMVNVIVPTKNRPIRLRLALESIAAQEYRDIAVTVVNDGGVPVADVAGAFADRLDLRLIELPASIGVSGARNLGIDQSAGDYLAFLDDDDCYLPEHLGLAVTTLTTNGAQFYFSGMLVHDRQLPAGQARQQPAKAVINYPNALDLLPLTNPFPTSGVVCAALRDTSIRFDTSLDMGEDWDMWLRMIHGHGYAAALQDSAANHGPTAIYVKAGNSDSALSAGSTDIASFWHMYESYLRTIARWAAQDKGQVARMRLFMELFYLICLNQLSAGSALPPHVFDAMQDAFARHLAGLSGESDLRRDLFLAAGAQPPSG
jgi:glycosyltransferase involved in cell wall biosynthesis